MSNISISVVIPLFNKENQIRTTLLSLFNQTFQNFEIIIINDGSTDRSVEQVKEFNDNRIRIISQTNQGVSVTRNNGIKAAQSDYVAFLDADDEWEPGYLETQMELIRKFEDCSVFACAYKIQRYNGKTGKVVLHKMPFSGESGILSNYFEVASCSSPPLWTSAVVAKKEALLSVGGFPANVHSGEDLLTWAKLAVNYKIAYSKKICAIYIMDKSYDINEKPSRLHDKKDVVSCELVKLYKNSSPKIKLSLKKYLSLWYKMKASVFLRLPDRKKALTYSFRSLKYNCRNSKVYLFILLALCPEFIQDFVKRKYQEIILDDYESN